ncbi:DEAD/DEAH box helicase family protein [Candidatus Pacearchaeota archaeon]|nr:DEAD/DEAH box helicase family protein [Candidatus Pacearchaeota archaeon]
MEKQNNKFKLASRYKPKGDQPKAIKNLIEGIKTGKKMQTLLGVTGSGKTFTMANVISKINKPTLIVAHNKTLAAQLYEEMREFFPNNRVEYFISYYDYYQPESYMPVRDQYIEKDSAINPRIEQMRHATTASLLSRNDVIVVASVSCIYGMGDPKVYKMMGLDLEVGKPLEVTGDGSGVTGDGSGVTGDGSGVTGNGSGVTGNGSGVTGNGSRVTGDGSRVTGDGSRVTGDGSGVTGDGSRVTGDRSRVTGRKALITKLVAMTFERNDLDLSSGRFRVKGDTIDLVPGYSNNIIRVEFFGDEIDRITEIDKNTGEALEKMKYFYIWPARNYVVPEAVFDGAIADIQAQLKIDLKEIADPLINHRLKQRTTFDIEMMRETGTCKGIENYSRHFDNRKEGEKAYCLLDYFGDDFLMIIDESHRTVPQVGGMFNGDRARKKNLIDYGFRLTSAFDNRPLRFKEFEKYMKDSQVVFVSATPGEYELRESKTIVEQIIRPTGLTDPEIEIRGVEKQIPDALSEIKKTVANGDRVLLTTLTKRMAEELTDFLAENGIKTRYLHSEIDTFERTEIIRELRVGTFDVLVGINLLREGIDIPEVGFVGVLDADKEGFLRDERSLIQIIGRAARNSSAKVVLYADKMTKSIRGAVRETSRRRKIQMAYNLKNNIKPQTIVKPIRESRVEIKDTKHIPKADIPNIIIQLEAEMREAAELLDFETAIALRNKMKGLSKRIERK